MLAYWQVCVAHPIVSLNKHVVVYFVCLRGGAITLLLRGQSLQLCYSLGFFLSNFFPAQFAQLHFSQCSSSVFLFVCLFSFLIKWCAAGFLHFWCDDWRVTRLYTFYVMTCILPWCVYIHSPRTYLHVVRMLLFMSDINKSSLSTPLIMFLCLSLSLWPFQLYCIP